MYKLFERNRKEGIASLEIALIKAFGFLIEGCPCEPDQVETGTALYDQSFTINDPKYMDIMKICKGHLIEGSNE